MSKQATYGYWTTEEEEKLLSWAARNPGIPPGYSKPTPELGDLLPMRTVTQIYHKWKKMTKKVGNKRTSNQGTSPRSKGLSSILETALSDYVNNLLESERAKLADGNGKIEELKQYIELLTEDNEKLKEELDKCKRLLRRLTKVREAVEEFRID